MILVTGGTGLVGSHLLLELTRKHERVRAIHRPTSNLGQVQDVFALYLNDPLEAYRRIEWVPGDMTDMDSLLEPLNGVEKVYHTAADVSFKPGDRLRLLDNNVGGTVNVVNACLEKNIKKLCFVSSTASLGDALPEEEITEDLLWTHAKHRSLYSVSKFNSEMEVWRGMAEGLNAVIVNPSIIIGPGDWNRSSSYLFTAVWKGMRFYTRGMTGYVDVRDVIHAMISLMDGNFSDQRYIVSSENLTYRQILEMIARALGKKPPGIFASPFLLALGWRGDWLVSTLTRKARMITRETARSSMRIAKFSNQKIRTALGMDFIPIEQSIQQTALHFLKAHGHKS
jgi:nucleoside-diphosphate-sugar epimerase